MQTSARPRTLVLVMSEVVVDVAMLGPRGDELGPRQVVPITSETATLWQAIGELGEFDRITLVGDDLGGLAARIANQSQRPLRRISHGALHWSGRIAERGVELALVLAPRLRSTLYHDGIEVPGLDLGAQLARKAKRYRAYLAPRVCEHKGPDAWMRRVARAVDEISTVWSPTTLYVATLATLPMPELPAHVQVMPIRETLEVALLAWGAPRARHAVLDQLAH